LKAGTNNWEKIDTSSAVTSYEGQWIHVAATYNGVGGTGASAGMAIYINGVSVSTATDDYGTYTAMSNRAGVLQFGRQQTDAFSSGQVSGVKIWNKELTATEVKEDYSGASVPFKYKGANQTDLVEAHDAGSGTAWTGATDTTQPDGWSAQGSNRVYTIDSSSGSGSEPALKIASGAAGNAGIIWGGTASLGKRYRATFSYKNESGATVVVATNEGATNLADSTGWTHGQTHEWTGDGAAGDFNFYVATANKNGWIDNCTIVPIGAVAEYDGSGAGEKIWGDKSGNDLHGTVTGATLENTPYDSGTEYEEGTWTPSFPSNTITGTLTGYYTKIGNLVNIQYTLDGLDWDGSGTTDILLSGLPYAQGSGKDLYGNVSGYYQINITGTGSLYWLMGNGLSTMTLNESVDNGATVVVNESAFNTSSGSYIRGEFSYRV